MVKRGGPTAEEFLTGMLVSAGGRRTSPRVILAPCRWGGEPEMKVTAESRKIKKKRTVNKGGFNLEEGEPEQQSYRFFSFGFTSKQKTRRCEKTENWDDYLRLECKGNTTVEGRTSSSFSQGRRTPSCIQRRRALSKQVPQHSGRRRDRKASCSFCSRTQVRFAPSNDVYVAL